MWRQLNKRIDPYLVLPLVLILSFSLVVIYSGNVNLALQHLLFSAIGLLIIVSLPLIDYRYVARVSPLLYLGLLVILAIVLLFGQEARGSMRWLDLGPFRFQPSEFAKVILIIFLARYLSSQPVGRLSLKKAIVTLIIFILPTALVFAQPDLGTAVTFMGVGLGLLFVGGVSWWFMGSGLVLFILSLPLVWNLMKDYQKQRIAVFLKPESDTLGSGYNVIQAIIAVGSGQLLGRGFGRGTQSHLRFLPEQHTDFIFATLAEEWGLLGVGLLLFFLMVLVYRILIIAQRSKTSFGYYLCLGVVLLLMIQIIINVGMNLGLMPVTGLPLPFVSYGGSALLAYSVALGLVHSIAVQDQS